MTYVCIHCGANWVKGKPTKYPDISGGICGNCATAYFRRKQREKGYHDCFKRAQEICAHKECTYWELCCGTSRY